MDICKDVAFRPIIESTFYSLFLCIKMLYSKQKSDHYLNVDK